MGRGRVHDCAGVEVGLGDRVGARAGRDLAGGEAGGGADDGRNLVVGDVDVGQCGRRRNARRRDRVRVIDRLAHVVVGSGQAGLRQRQGRDVVGHAVDGGVGAGTVDRLGVVAVQGVRVATDPGEAGDRGICDFSDPQGVGIIAVLSGRQFGGVQRHGHGAIRTGSDGMDEGVIGSAVPRGVEVEGPVRGQNAAGREIRGIRGDRGVVFGTQIAGVAAGVIGGRSGSVEFVRRHHAVARADFRVEDDALDRDVFVEDRRGAAGIGRVAGVDGGNRVVAGGKG